MQSIQDMILPQEIFELAQRASVLDYQELMTNRSKNGFQHFIMDLKLEPEMHSATYDAAHQTGWHIKGGLLTVYKNHNTDELMNFLEAKLAHYPWFESRAIKEQQRRASEYIEPPTLPQGFVSYTEIFKSLGKWGPNKAIDVITFIQNTDGSLSVQVITRPFDKKYAFVGGMLEDENSVLETCFMELLEEFYSNDLFAKSSATARKANQINSSDMLIAVETCLNDKKFATLTSIRHQLMDEMRKGSNFETQFTNLKNKLFSFANQDILQTNQSLHKHRKEDLDHLFVSLKCKLYVIIFPDNYQKLIEFFRSRLIQMKITTNESDPRNTQEGYMQTIPHYLCVNRNELQDLETTCLVKPKGGDDAESAKIVKLEKLFEQSMFSAHGRILLEAVADMLEKHRPDILQNLSFQNQMRQLERNILDRESSRMSLLNNNNGLCFVQQTGSNQPHLPVASSVAGVEILHNLTNFGSSGDLNVQIAGSAEQARAYLLNSLGQIRFSRIEQELERLRIPYSMVVAIAENAKLGKAIVVIDNSTSMRDTMKIISEDDQGNKQIIRMPRWKQQERRIEAMLPLLAMAGIHVEFRFLNDQKYSSHQLIKAGIPQSYNFGVNRELNGTIMNNDVNLLEGELTRATAFVKAIFEQSPEGATKFIPILQAVYKDAGQDGLTRAIVFLTDGELTDRDQVMPLMQNPSKSNLVRTMVIVCTDRPQDILWVRELSKNPALQVSLLDEYAIEKVLLQRTHSQFIPYDRSIWIGLHMVLPLPENDPIMQTGIYLYLQAAKLNRQLTQPEISEMLGYGINDVQYAYYITSSSGNQSTNYLDITMIQSEAFKAVEEEIQRSSQQPAVAVAVQGFFAPPPSASQNQQGNPSLTRGLYG